MNINRQPPISNTSPNEILGSQRTSEDTLRAAGLYAGLLANQSEVILDLHLIDPASSKTLKHPSGAIIRDDRFSEEERRVDVRLPDDRQSVTAIVDQGDRHILVNPPTEQDVDNMRKLYIAEEERLRALPKETSNSANSDNS